MVYLSILGTETRISFERLMNQLLILYTLKRFKLDREVLSASVLILIVRTLRIDAPDAQKKGMGRVNN